MHWKIKASLQKVLHFTKIGDQLNHIPATLRKAYHKNVCLYQFYECIRKFEASEIQFNANRETSVLEIGTGYSFIAPVVLFLLGFDKIVTVDISKDVSIKTFQKQVQYLNDETLLQLLAEKGKRSLSDIQQKLVEIESFQTLEKVTEYCHITYIPKYTLQAIEKVDTAFDYICSQVVFEHIPPEFLEKLFSKMKHWLTEDGCAVHTINFIDHFANPGFFQDTNISEFNFLKYSDKTWNFWAGNDIAYTNRLSYLYYLELCEVNNLHIVDFIGENYRVHHPLLAEEIHEDVIKKYKQLANVAAICKYQRGTLIFKKIKKPKLAL
ncbi:methyltransferase domain protein [Kordia sp. SMS9]|uniref:class I SAM-dependent methyltransferase n=1 Tax=Kordia sp. SMS9 TaxID=2282170 RepID=UPI000E0DDB47|nr:class I SAM-dependent methyltransferase [Kordia sp. SMS9]AXG68140.1 methyltransferase domain protein [Kordia sp. SMS9]